MTSRGDRDVIVRRHEASTDSRATNPWSKVIIAGSVGGACTVFTACFVFCLLACRRWIRDKQSARRRRLSRRSRTSTSGDQQQQQQQETQRRRTSGTSLAASPFALHTSPPRTAAALPGEVLPLPLPPDVTPSSDATWWSQQSLKTDLGSDWSHAFVFPPSTAINFPVHSSSSTGRTNNVLPPGSTQTHPTWNSSARRRGSTGLTSSELDDVDAILALTAEAEVDSERLVYDQRQCGRPHTAGGLPTTTTTTTTRLRPSEQHPVQRQQRIRTGSYRPPSAALSTSEAGKAGTVSKENQNVDSYYRPECSAEYGANFSSLELVRPTNSAFEQENVRTRNNQTGSRNHGPDTNFQDLAREAGYLFTSGSGTSGRPGWMAEEDYEPDSNVPDYNRIHRIVETSGFRHASLRPRRRSRISLGSTAAPPNYCAPGELLSASKERNTWELTSCRTNVIPLQLSGPSGEDNPCFPDFNRHDDDGGGEPIWVRRDAPEASTSGGAILHRGTTFCDVALPKQLPTGTSRNNAGGNEASAGGGIAVVTGSGKMTGDKLRTNQLPVRHCR